MRDHLFLIIILLSLPVCFLRPYIGILMWSWISYMNPHKLTWTLRHFSAAQYVAIATLLGYALYSGQKKIPIKREVVFIAILWVVFTFTSAFSLYPQYAWTKWIFVSKILLMNFITIPLMLDKTKLYYLLLTIVFSVGFYGIKGAIFSLLTGGIYPVRGPEDSFIEDNNAMALGLLMIIPIAFYLAMEEKNRKMKTVLHMLTFLSCLSAVFTYSRGGFITLMALLFMLLIKLRKLRVIAFITLLALLFIPFIPEKWHERMATITKYQQDGSAMGRINAWHFAWNLALDMPLTGGGFESFQPDLFRIYAPNPDDFHDSHSIYFAMLGHHGFIGLGIFLSLLTSTFLSLRKLKKTFKHIVSHQWLVTYCEMISMSLTSYAVGGLFLGMAYFDLFYHLVAIVVIMKVLAERALQTYDEEHMVTHVDISDAPLTSAARPAMLR